MQYFWAVECKRKEKNALWRVATEFCPFMNKKEADRQLKRIIRSYTLKEWRITKYIPEVG